MCKKTSADGLMRTALGIFPCAFSTSVFIGYVRWRLACALYKQRERDEFFGTRWSGWILPLPLICWATLGQVLSSLRVKMPPTTCQSNVQMWPEFGILCAVINSFFTELFIYFMCMSRPLSAYMPAHQRRASHPTIDGCKDVLNNPPT